MKFCILVKGRGWTFQLADSLCKLNNLESLVTTHPKYHVKKYKVPSNKIKSVFSLYIIERIIRQFIHPFLKKIKIYYDPNIFYDWLADTIFSLFFIKKCDFLLIGFGSSTNKIQKKAKEKKIKTIYFLNTSSFSYQKIVEEEYNKLGLSKLYFKEPKMLTNQINESIKMADYIGALSSSQKQTYIDDGFDESKMFLSYLGVDTSVFFPKKVEKNKFVVITSGNNFVRKGIKYLIEAFNSLKLNNSELWIVGTNDKNFAKKIVKIEKNNVFLGSIDEFELPNLYNQANVFCLPTFEEGLPAVIPQAMACALPIISTHFANDIVTNGQEGFIIEPGDTLIIKEKIKFFYDNPNKAIEMGNKARIRAVKDVSNDAVAKRIIEFCNNINTKKYE